MSSYIPYYIRQSINNIAGDTITANRWNELWNLSVQSNDANSQALHDLINTGNIKPYGFTGTQERFQSIEDNIGILQTIGEDYEAFKIAQESTNTVVANDITTLGNTATAQSGRITTNEVDISNIKNKIPSTATALNQLADKDFVNSSITTATAYFRGTFNSTAELNAYSGTKTINDYAYVVIYDPSQITQVKQYDRYKWDGTQWLFEYTLNNSSFTASQWAAINSGITSAIVGTENARLVCENFNATKAYEVCNKVVYQGSTYYCIQDTTAGTLPTDTDYWLLIAKKGDDGEASHITASKSDGTTTLTITDSTGTSTVDILDGTDGTDGTDGISPTISTNKVGKTTTLTITDVNGTHTATIMDGADGAGSGDMLTNVYDPTNKAQDIFAYVDDAVSSISVPTKTSDLTNDSNFVSDVNYIHTDNNYTTTEKNKLASLSNYDDTTLNGKVTTIEGKIPDEATSSNKLADKNFVNSSISTNTATFRGNFNSVAELEAYSGTKTNNDYAYVKTTGTDGLDHIVRYKYNGTSWAVEFDVNNSIFTAQQFAWLNTVVDGTTITNVDGVLSATAQTPSIATTSTAGIVKPDGTSINISADGTISASSTSNVEAIKESEFTQTYKNNMQDGSIAIVVKNV